MNGSTTSASGGTRRAQLWVGSVGSLVLRLSYVGLGSVTAIVLARVLGPTNYGVYVYAYALITMLAIPARFGLPALVVRETARLEAGCDWRAIRGLWRWANVVTASGTLLIVAIAGAVAWLVWGVGRGEASETFELGLALVPLIALGSLRGASLRGLRKVVQGQLPEEIIRPILLVLLVLLLAELSNAKVTPSQTMVAHVLAALVAFGAGALMLRWQTPSQLCSCDTVVYQTHRWLVAVLPFAAMEGMFFLNNQVDLILLGAFASAKDVGVYKVASQGATFVGLGFQALGMALMPHYTRLHALRDKGRFETLSTVGTLSGFMLGLPVLVVFLAFGRPILSYVFGAGYVIGYVALMILSASQLLNVFFGMSGRLLNAAGYERAAMWGILVGAGCNVLLNVALIPVYGMNGAAVATGVSLVVWNIVLWQMSKRYVGIDSSLMAIFNGGSLARLRQVVFRRA